MLSCHHMLHVCSFNDEQKQRASRGPVTINITGCKEGLGEYQHGVGSVANTMHAINCSNRDKNCGCNQRSETGMWYIC